MQYNYVAPKITGKNHNDKGTLTILINFLALLFYNWGQGDKEGGQCAKDLLPWQSYAVSQWVHGFCRHNLES